MITERIKCAILGHEWRYYDFEHSKCGRCGKIVDYFEMKNV